MAGVMYPNSIPRATLTNHPLESPRDIVPIRFLVSTVVHEDSHVGAVKSHRPLEVLGDVVHVVVTTTQLALLPDVIDPD